MRVLDYAFGFKQWFPGHRFDTWRVFFCMRFVYATVLSLISFVLEDSNFYLTWSIFLTKVSFWSKQLRQIISVKSNFRSISVPRRSSKLKQALVFSDDAPVNSFLRTSAFTTDTQHWTQIVFFELGEISRRLWTFVGVVSLSSMKHSEIDKIPHLSINFRAKCKNKIRNAASETSLPLPSLFSARPLFR